ncbi:MAG: hypothetical protein IPL25_19835 [Saprospiraceae bacterium]|nr:hypothetical protein [Candidatus Vicinibacter affinis]
MCVQLRSYRKYRKTNCAFIAESKEKIRIISRNAEKAKELTDQGAELFMSNPLMLNY